MAVTRGLNQTLVLLSLLSLTSLSTSQKTCPSCGSMEVPYPLSTNPSCGDPNYPLLCDPHEKKLYLNALNGSSYLVLGIQPLSQTLVVRPPPWIPGTCITQDRPKSEGLWLNQSLPFNITPSNTIFLFNCSPRLLVSPLNCTTASLCHGYLDGGLGRADSSSCTTGPGPCCTFITGGMPSAYKIRLHSSGCQAFRSVIHLDPEKPPSQWEEGLEIQWATPPEPICRTQLDCAPPSTCSAGRCLCSNSYYWNPPLASCSRDDDSTGGPHSSVRHLAMKVLISGLGSLALVVMVAVAIVRLRCGAWSKNKSKMAKEREDMIKASNDGRSARIFGWKEVRKATDGFSKERILGIGGFGEVYKGILEDGTLVAVKSAKVGNIKSTQQVLNEVRILSLVNHKNLVRLLGCCVESKEPLLIYEYVPNGTLHGWLHKRSEESVAILDWKARLKIALQAAEALAYLHSSAHTPIYHRDVKSNNILLDQDLNAKVSDFGLSRLAQPGLSHVSTCAQGTLGYLDPEYYRNYRLTDKSDVYSFGVVLLELLTSKKVIDFSRQPDDVNLAVHATRRAKEGAGMELVDTALFAGDEGKGGLRSAELFLELAIRCLGEKKDERPSMKEVAEELQYILEITMNQEQGEFERGSKQDNITSVA